MFSGELPQSPMVHSHHHSALLSVQGREGLILMIFIYLFYYQLTIQDSLTVDEKHRRLVSLIGMGLLEMYFENRAGPNYKTATLHLNVTVESPVFIFGQQHFRNIALKEDSV